MAKLTELLVVIAAVALLVAGCPSQRGSTDGGTPKPATSGAVKPSPQPVSGGTLRLPLEIGADEPALAALDFSDQRLWAVARAIQLPLVRVSPAGKALRGLATSWQSDDSGQVWTFELQTPAQQTGEDSLAQKYLDRLRGILRGEETPVRQQLADLVAGATDYRDGKELDVSGLSLTDTGLKIQLTRPDWEFPLWLSQPGLGLPGYGPFVLEPDSSTSGVLVLKPNPQSLAGQPLLDELRFVCQPDREKQLSMFRAGELDAASIPDHRVSQVQSNSTLTDAVVQHDTAEMLLGIYNYSRFPWNDGKFQSRVGLRSAMNWGLDREMLAEVHSAQFTPWPHFLPPVWQDMVNPARLSEPRFPLTPRIEEARKGMIEADHEQGIRLPQGMDVAYLPDESTRGLAMDIMDYWREISIKMGPFGEPQQTLLDRVVGEEHEVIIKRVRPAYPSPDALFYAQLYSALSGAGGNWTRLEDSDIDKEVAEIQGTQDQVSRQIIMRKLGDELEDRALFVFIGYSTPTMLISPRLAGYELGPYDFDASLQSQDFALLGWAAAPAD